jgi:ABC-type nitrate/sulfonate/bicarbonate transport system substrate-binding protein
MSKFKKTWVLLIVILLMLGLGGCGSQESNSNSAGSSNDSNSAATITVGDITGAELAYAPFHIALQKGFFEEEGLKIERRIFTNGPNMMMSVTNGELDVAMAGSTPILQAAAQGADVKIIMSITKDNAPVVARKDIATFKDLDGKVVGTPGLGTIQNTMLSLAAEKEGIKFGRLVHGKITDLVVFFQKGEIDGFTGWEWIAADAVVNYDAHYVIKKPVLPNAESCEIAVSSKFIQENPEAVKKVVRAYYKAMKFIQDNPEETIQIMSKLTNKSEEVIKLSLETTTVTKPEIDMPSMKFEVEDAINTGKIRKEAVPDVDEFINKYVDQSFLEKVKNELK